ncbi:phospholipase C, phosphocholine-specific [Duganella sp. CY15W]|uniref:phosphocholine-specific phospholipase C n=1 Tax=Duganella sp. CY15W TaxID=2692172 RepID=UPI00136BADE8|nr:phospholipase C, phosphocholine-specific [Duganella sp. CY15W]MYM29513.1 phospholipase C, phosphocholine-specific [Duganella sp. CY15W]
MSTSRRNFLRYAVAGAGVSATTVFPDLIREALAIPANNATGTLADIGHVVILMQENRSFDHYFGALAGVRGFDDPRAIDLPNGRPVWYQPDAAGGYVLPFHFDAKNTSALSVGLDHSWKGAQATWQGWDAWVKQKSAQTMGYFNRGDLPFYYALADAFTICDAYHCSIFGATDPNRLYSLSGTNQGWFGAMGGLYNISAGGIYNADPANDNLSAAVTGSAPNWQTYAEVLQANGVSWKVYQEWDNYGDNYLAYFKNFRVNADGSRLSASSPLAQNGRVMAPGSSAANAAGTKGDLLVRAFADDVQNNRLPQVSWISAPTEYCEHPSHSPNAGESITARLLAALVANPAVWSKTVFLLMYDENDGFFDHVPSDMAPLNTGMGKTTLADIGAYESYQGIPVGLGPRVPMLVISPWSKGGRVCSQLFDHTSKLRFLEEWLVQGLGKDRASITCSQISPWRRTVCGDLTSAFDFKHPNSDWPTSAPKTAAYAPVSGKPSPVPPAVQTLPRQEEVAADGPRYACPLPYMLQVQASNNGNKQLAVSFSNLGQVGAAFIVYSSLRSDGPWYYTVEAGKSIDNEMWNWSGSSYALSVHGANGFLRQFAGTVAQAAGGARPELQCMYSVASNGIWLTLSNVGGQQACRFTINDNAYGVAQASYTVAAGQTLAIDYALADSFGWYDFTVTCDADALWSRRVAGHVETGAASRVDPMIGTNKSRIVFDTSTPYAMKGAPLNFNYAAPNGKLDPKNWIGLYAAGRTPGNGSSALWSYAPDASGSVAFSTGTLAVGDYAAWYLYQDGYQALGGPVAVSVTQLAASTASVKQGTPMLVNYALPASKVSSTNWIGIWKAGVTPGSGSYLTWQYATAASGSVSIDTSKLAPGSYSAWCLYANGYTLMAGPANFTVT